MIEASILIPCYNAERWIERCVVSALVQKPAGIEVLVADDGSTDSSMELLQNHAGRVRILSQPRKGANHARNRLLAEARGEWVQFLDADDELMPGKIEDQLAIGREVRADVLAGGVTCEVWRDGVPQRPEAIKVGEDDDLIALWLAWRFPQTGGILWRRDKLLGMGGWKVDMPCCQDYEVVMRAFQTGLKVVSTPGTGAIYRHWSEETLSRKNVTETLQVRTSLCLEMRNWLEDTGAYSAGRRSALGRSLFEMSRSLAKYDLEKAAEYYQAHWRDMTETGPAAPWHYLLAKRTFGFRNAEKLAAYLRYAN